MRLRIVTLAASALVFILGLQGIVGAQSKEIAREVYWKTYRDALAKSGTLSRRQNQKIKSTWNDKTHEEEWTYEYQPPERIRYVHLETRDGKTVRTEQIDLGGTKYCKKGEADWVVAKSCIGGSGSGGPSNIIKELFSRENVLLDGRRAVLYRESVTYINVHSKTADSDGPTLWESQFWIDRDGLVLRAESRRGLSKNAEPSFELVETYTYDPGIMIEAPIK